MGYAEKRFESGLAMIAECSWSIEYSSQTFAVHPDGFADLFITGSGQIYVAGTAKSTRSFGSEFAGSLKGVRLKPLILRRLFDVPAYELTDLVVPLEDISSGRAKQIASMLHGVDSADQVVALISEKLNERVAERDLAPGRMFAHVLSRLDSEPVAQIASGMGITERHLHRLFLDYAGVSPTRMRRIRRLQGVLDVMRHWKKGSSLASCALACGFADQAHFTRDVRDLTGASPACLLRELQNP